MPCGPDLGLSCLQPADVPPNQLGLEAVRHFYTLVLPDEGHKITSGYIDDLTVDDFVRFWKVRRTLWKRLFMPWQVADLEARCSSPRP